jgi:sugar/nucleoside kinase (ribokinase family)
VRVWATSRTEEKRALALSLGADGAFEPGARLPERVDAVMETTGAGDAFVGGFAASLADGQDPLEAARFGSAAAGISVTRPGTAQAMPRREEIEMLLNEQPQS